MIWDLISGRDVRVFSSPKHQDWHFGPLSLICSGYWRSFLYVSKLTTHLHQVTSQEFVEPVPVLHICAFIVSTGPT
jgi:hypothetical protein